MKKTMLMALVLVAGCAGTKVSDSQRIPAQDSSAAVKVFEDSGVAKRTPWGGYWWSMARGELVMGWDDGKGRKIWTEGNIKMFDRCLDSYSKECVDLFKNIAKEGGKHLSPMMKFDYYIRMRNEKLYGKNNGLKGMYSHASLWEMKYAYIGNNDSHPLWDVRGFAGKCIGWSLSTMDYDEPIKDVTLEGVTFKPTDIKGLLAARYNVAKYFAEGDLFLGSAVTVYPPMEEKEYEAARADITPKQLMIALGKTVKKGNIIIADMDPSEGSWNHPIYKYKAEWKFSSKTKISGEITLHYPSDELGIDDVFSTTKERKDLLSRTLPFEMKVPVDFTGDFNLAESEGEWLGEAKEKHPDVIILGLEKDWMTTFFKEKLDNIAVIAQDTNPPLLKREKVGKVWKPILDGLLDSYYKKNK